MKKNELVASLSLGGHVLRTVSKHHLSEGARAGCPTAAQLLRLSVLVTAATFIGCVGDECPEGLICLVGSGGETTGGAPGTGGFGGAGGVVASGGLGGEGAAGGAGGAGASGGTGGAGSVTLIQLKTADGEPAIAVDLTVNGVDGTLIEHVLSDTSGSANVVIPAGGSVTAFHTIMSSSNRGPYRTMTTMVPDGPEVPEVRFTLQSFTELIEDESMTIQLAFPPKAGATYQIRTPCANYVTSVNSFTGPLPRCYDIATYDVWVTALVNGQPVDYALLEDQPYVLNSLVAHSLSWSNATLVPTALTANNIPVSGARLGLNTTIDLSADAGHWTPWSDSVDVMAPANTEIAQLLQFAAPNARHCRRMWLELDQMAPEYEALGFVDCAPQVSSAASTWDTSRLTRYQTLATTDLDESAEPFVVWPGDSGDILSIDHLWYRSTATGRWTVVRSPSDVAMAPVPFPQLPSSLDDYRFVSGVDTLGEVTVAHTDDLDVVGLLDAYPPSFAPVGISFEFSNYTTYP